MATKSTKTTTGNSALHDVVVIGGGPSGMMAASEAARSGARVVLLEKNPQLGKKLLITGGGRCNVTNNKPEVREMLSQYKAEGKFLFSTFMQHGVKESMEWFKSRQVPLKEENEGRLFPQTESAQTVRDALAAELQLLRVDVRNKLIVADIKKQSDGLFVISLLNAEPIIARAVVVATGGVARPETGSTGEGFEWLKCLGHIIVPNNFALVPLTLKNSWTSKLSGIALPKVKIAVWSDGKKQTAVVGKLLFTHVGVTGPTILNLSKQIGEWLSYAPVTLKVDLFPELDPGQLKERLTKVLSIESNKKLQNALATELPLALVKGLLCELQIDGETPCHSVSREDRRRLVSFLKSVPLEVKELLGADKAVVSAGGVALTEVDFKTMESTIVPGLFLVGDVLNINRPSGGYSLQLCWSTGAVAGLHAAKHVL